MASSTPRFFTRDMAGTIFIGRLLYVQPGRSGLIIVCDWTSTAEVNGPVWQEGVHEDECYPLMVGELNLIPARWLEAV